MIIFALRAFRQRLIVRPSILIWAFVPLLFAQSVFAQSDGELFRGTWQVETPDNGSLILLIKRNQLASYFLGDNADRTVYQGSWEVSENTAIATWADGSAHHIIRDELGFGITYFDVSGQAVYSTPAQQVPPEVLGQWAKAPRRDQELRSDRDEAKGFFGIWKVGDESNAHYVIVESDRSAASNWSPREGTTRGLRGAWAKQGSELHVAWDSGHYSILRENPRGHSYQRIEPATEIETASAAPLPASRVAKTILPSDWFSQYEGEKSSNSGGIAFTSRKVARNFYRGSWIISGNEELFERIEIGRFGGLNTSGNRSLEGSWLLSGQDVFLRWDDGLREILSPVGWGFVVYEYKPGRPLDGVPNRIYAAAPSDKEKLTAHLKERAEVSKQMIEMAEAAGVDPSADPSGWGRTFMRWAWPFGEEGSDQSAEELLQTEYEITSGNDPWWWPFWSEDRQVSNKIAPSQANDDPESSLEKGNEAAETNSKKVEAVDPTAKNEDVSSHASKVEESSSSPAESPEVGRPKSPNSDRKKNWIWPF